MELIIAVVGILFFAIKHLVEGLIDNYRMEKWLQEDRKFRDEHGLDKFSADSAKELKKLRQEAWDRKYGKYPDSKSNNNYSNNRHIGSSNDVGC